jgi:hypothetical protein
MREGVPAAESFGGNQDFGRTDAADANGTLGLFVPAVLA